MNPLENKNIVLGVTGSIAAYKAADLASKLSQSGAVVKVILTELATKFVSSITYQSLTGNCAYTDGDLWGGEAHVLHIGLAHEADLIVIAPATATTIAKLANGIADNLLTVTVLAGGSDLSAVPLLIAPAMDAGMYSNPATQENIKTLVQRGAVFIGPDEGHLASGLKAKGRMSEPEEIAGCIRYSLSRGGVLHGKKILVTAGGTREDIDPVRFITNRSTGKQGFALAQAGLDAGAEVVLISTPNNLRSPFGVTQIQVRTAEEMKNAVLQNCADADAICMAAAVSDFRPMKVSSIKIKKVDSGHTLSLEPTDDILLKISRIRIKTNKPGVVVGFAAESQDLVTNARAKLDAKNLDLIVANNILSKDTGFASETNQVVLLFPDGQQENLPVMTKYQVAERIILEITKLLSR